MNVLLVLSILLAVTSVGYAVAVPKQGESFTKFYLLTRGESELTAADYPTKFVAGDGRSSWGSGTKSMLRWTTRWSSYSSACAFVGNETMIEAERELDRFGARLAHNHTFHRDYTVEPTMTGTRLRLAILLYRGTAPAEPSVERTYRETHLWVNVSESR